jgi:hypothetical protein
MRGSPRGEDRREERITERRGSPRDRGSPIGEDRREKRITERRGSPRERITDRRRSPREDHREEGIAKRRGSPYPIRYPYNSNWRCDQHFVKHLQRQIRGQFC